jgi:hypothetical protein
MRKRCEKSTGQRKDLIKFYSSKRGKKLRKNKDCIAPMV